MIVKEDIINDIIKINKKIKKPPSKSLYEKIGKYSTSPIKRLFGSWSNAVYESLGIKISTPQPRQEIFCRNCGKTTKNPKFCSSSCSTSFYNQNKNGRKTGRKKIQQLCVICNKPCRPRTIRCDNCKLKIKTNNNNYVSIEKLTKQQVLTNNTQKYSRIRAHAKLVAEANGLLNKCFYCGYDVHVECCHLQGIGTFPNDCLILEINNLKNLLGLCRNHHWELDNLPNFRKQLLKLLESKS